VNDANSVKGILERNENGTKNFDCNLLIAKDSEQSIARANLKDNILKLFSTRAEIALFYFAGHGHIEATGGYLLASDSKRGDEGVSLSEILTMANKSPASNKIIILDSCHSGIAGNVPSDSDTALLSDGLTILTASTEEQYASEENGSGVFTTLLVDALNGSAANLIGEVTPGSVYAHIDQALGGWEQRPVFKTNVKKFVSLRQVKLAIEIEDLRKLLEFFPTSSFEFPLDPTYEPELKGRDSDMPQPDIKNTKKFTILQKFNLLNLLVPIGAPHMWHAAMHSKACKLTRLGEHYWRLVKKNRI
jgi:hypothetical protein